MDSLEQEIIHLINQESDARNKAYLLISFRMHQDLKKNTEATINTSEKVEELTTEISSHRVIFDQLRGGWRAVMVGIALVSLLFGVIQALGGYIVVNHLEDSKMGFSRLEEIEKRIYNLEKVMDILHPQNGSR